MMQDLLQNSIEFLQVGIISLIVVGIILLFLSIGEKSNRKKVGALILILGLLLAGWIISAKSGIIFLEDISGMSLIGGVVLGIVALLILTYLSPIKKRTYNILSFFSLLCISLGLGVFSYNWYYTKDFPNIVIVIVTLILVLLGSFLLVFSLGQKKIVEQNISGKWNVLSILSFFLTFLFAFAGGAIIVIILSIISLYQIKKDPSQKGKGLAIISMIIGIVKVIFIGLYNIFL